MMIKKYIFVVTLLCITQPTQAIMREVLDIVTAGALAGGAVYAGNEAKKEFKKLDSNKIFKEQKKQLAKDIQETNLKKIGNSTKGIMCESAKPVLLTAYAAYTGLLALVFFIDAIR